MKIGNTVEALDEDVTGKIIKIDGDTVTIDSDGFEMEFNKNELIIVKDRSLDKHVFSSKSSRSVIAEKESHDRPFLKPKPPKKNERPPLEVDLHAHQLSGTNKYMSKHDILNLQLETAKRQIEFAIRKNIQKVVLIHGVGEGVLKMELDTILRRYDNLKFYGADSKKYGFGATEVYIFQNH